MTGDATVLGTAKVHARSNQACILSPFILVECMARGVDLIFAEQVRCGNPAPRCETNGQTGVNLTLHAAVAAARRKHCVAARGLAALDALPTA